MNQRPIDLLPESIRLACQAGLRTGRYIAMVCAGILLVVVLTTHSRVQLDRSKQRWEQARQTADLVLQTEARAKDLNAQLEEAERMIVLHDQIAYPIRVSSVLATLVNQMPSSVSLDRVDLTARTMAPRSRPQGSSDRGGSEQTAPRRRLLAGELSGFAASDADIIALIDSLENASPFNEVNLDFTRTRNVRGHSAREFRISLRIDLDAEFEDTVAHAR